MRAMAAIDRLDHRFGFYLLSVLLLWLIGFLAIDPSAGFKAVIFKAVRKVR